MNPRHLLAVLTVAAVVGCAPYASVSPVQPRFHPAGAPSGAIARVGPRIEAALVREKREPLAALGGYLGAARIAQQQLARDTADSAARDTYNFAVARVISAIQQASLDPWSRPLAVSAPDGEFLLVHKPHPELLRDPARFDLIPADQLEIKGGYVRERQRKEGIGAPLVAVERGAREHERADFRMPELCYGITALIRFEGRRAVTAFEDPLDTEQVTFAGRSFPLAADFTAPIAVTLARENPRRLELSGLLRPDDQARARLIRTQPYDPEKTVVLIIHGLKDSPATWVPMLNHLQADQELRRNYQVWLFGYPSGYPYPHSAAILRRELDSHKRRYPPRKKMIVIGHSMGGCISRLLITDTGDKLWRGIFRTPPDETPLPAGIKAQLREELVFRHRSEIGRVIFIAAPLRGSDLARSWVGRFGSALVKLPSSVLDTGNAAVHALAFEGGELRLDRAPNSMDLLTPDNRFVRVLQTIPVTPGIPHHVICGDRGNGGHKDKTRPIMSDGVVPYWSSHMETAASELVVPSDYSAHQHPDAIAEVERILKRHAGR